MARVWSHPDLTGTRNGANVNFTVPLPEGGLLVCIIFNGRKIYRKTLSPGAQEYTITGNAVVLGLAPNADDTLWCYVVVEDTAAPTTAIALVQSIRRTFYYTAWAYNKQQELQEVLERDISASRWSYFPIGGCGEAELILRRPYDDFGQIALDWGIEIWRERDLLGQAGIRLPAQLPLQLGTAHAGDRELRWSGFVREIERILGDDEQVILKCAGWSRQMAYVFVPIQEDGGGNPAPWEHMDVAAIVRDIVDRYVVPGTQIKRTPGLGLVPDTGVTVNSFNVDTTAFDAISTLAVIAGNAEWGVRPDKEFYFVQPTNAVKQTHVIADRVLIYRPRTSTDEIVKTVHLRGANGFKATVNIGTPEPGYYKERREVVAGIQTAEVAQLWAAAYAARFGDSSPSGALQLGMTDDWIENVQHPLGLLRVIGAPVFVTQGEALPAQLPMKLGVSYGKYTDERFKIGSITYTPTDDALNLEIGLGARKRPLADLFETINFKIGELQQGLTL
jgi:hypothetical protein